MDVCAYFVSLRVGVFYMHLFIYKLCIGAGLRHSSFGEDGRGDFEGRGGHVFAALLGQASVENWRADFGRAR